MFIQFSIGNYRSIRELEKISLLAQGSMLHEPQNTFSVPCCRKALLKSAILYGANASGKSNLVRGFHVMQTLVRKRGVQDNQAQTLLSPFKLSPSTDTTPLHLEMELISQGQRFRYGFECLPDRIVSEWLYTQKKRMTLMFAREDNQFVHQSPDCRELTAWHKILSDTKLKLPEDALFLPMAANMFAGGACETVYNWFDQTLVVLSAETFQQYLGHTLTSLRHPQLARQIERLITKADFGIQALRPIYEDSQGDFISAPPKPQVLTQHRVHDQTYELDLFKDESHGTQKVFALSAPLLEVLQNGKVLVIDELDSSLHPLLASQVLELFHAENQNNAQIIATAHSPSLLTETSLRKDQVWFASKNQDGVTSFTSLANFTGIRGNFNQIVKDYLHGCYGGIPTITDLNTIFKTTIADKNSSRPRSGQEPSKGAKQE